MAVLAVGTLGDYSTADPAIVERDSKPRERLPLEQVAFAGRWGAAVHGGHVFDSWLTWASNWSLNAVTTIADAGAAAPGAVRAACAS